MKTCCTCKIPKPISKFFRDRSAKDGYESRCKLCSTAKVAAWRLRHPGQASRIRREWNLKHPQRYVAFCRARRKARRVCVLKHYGGACFCCGETQYEFLALDHTEGGGNKHRSTLGIKGRRMVDWIIENNFPPMFRVACHNCNMAIAIYGSCPHEQSGDTILSVPQTEPCNFAATGRQVSPPGQAKGLQ